MNKKWLAVLFTAGLMAGNASSTIAQTWSGGYDGSRTEYGYPARPYYSFGGYPQNVSSSSTQQLPADAQELIAQYQKDAKPIRREAGRKIRELQAPLLTTLKQMQDRYTRDAKLDEAVAIRDYRRMMQDSHLKVLPDPGGLYQFANMVGRTFFFRVTGGSGRIDLGYRRLHRRFHLGSRRGSCRRVEARPDRHRQGHDPAPQNLLSSIEPERHPIGRLGRVPRQLQGRTRQR